MEEGLVAEGPDFAPAVEQGAGGEHLRTGCHPAFEGGALHFRQGKALGAVMQEAGLLGPDRIRAETERQAAGFGGDGEGMGETVGIEGGEELIQMISRALHRRHTAVEPEGIAVFRDGGTEGWIMIPGKGKPDNLIRLEILFQGGAQGSPVRRDERLIGRAGGCEHAPPVRAGNSAGSVFRLPEDQHDTVQLFRTEGGAAKGNMPGAYRVKRIQQNTNTDRRQEDMPPVTSGMINMLGTL